MSDYSDKKVLCYDSGTFPHVAEVLARDFKTVFYFSPWVDQYPTSRKAMVGVGLGDNIERIYDRFEYYPEADLIVFTDLYSADEAAYLKNQGKRVWSPLGAELLELARWETHQWLKLQGMDVPRSELIEGLEELRTRLFNEDHDCYVKTSLFRGDFETFHHKDYRLSQTWLDELAHMLGPRQYHIPLIVEESIEGVEVGFDGYQVNGQFPDPCLYGYEHKDKAFVGQVVPYDELPKVLAETNKTLVPKLRGTASFFSTEVRVTPEGKFYLLDPCMRCYSADTEVLTDVGWKLFRDLKLVDKVATLNPETHNIEYHIPSAYQSYWYEGEMVNFTSPKSVVDLLVTPDHTVWGSRRHPEGQLENQSASSISGKWYVPRTGIWRGEEPKIFSLPAYKNIWQAGRREIYKSAKDLPMESWLRFLGYYLSEGCVVDSPSNSSQSIRITQTKYVQEMADGMKSLPFTIHQSPQGFTISDVQLSAYLVSFDHAPEKYVPPFVKSLSPRLIRIFLDAYILGDGTRHKNGGQVCISTTSKLMADDLQELFLKAGTMARIVRREDKGTIMSCRGQEYFRNFDTYLIYERSAWSEYYFEAGTQRESDYIKHVFYKGWVYDVTVPNHIIYVRREGKPLWSGNCGSPPSAAYLELFTNWSDILWNGAQGELVNPEPRAKYAAQIMMRSPDAVGGHWLPIYYPTKLATYVKLGNKVVLPEGTFVANQGPEDSTIGGVTGFGDTLEQAIKECLEHVEEVDALGLEYDIQAFDELLKTVEKGKDYGVDW